MSSTEKHVLTEMEWSNERVLEFLEAFQSEPSLWDTRQKNHKNRGVQTDAWRRIKQCLSFPSTIDDLKKKKESLMNYYRNHLNKYKKSLQSGAGTSEIYSTNWFAFELMNSFLRPIYESNSELNSEVPPSNERVDSEVQETNQHIDSSASTTTDQSLGQTMKRPSSCSQQSTKQRFIKKNVPPPEIIAAKKQIDEAFNHVKNIQSQNQKRDLDEYDHFGLMIAAKIRKIKDHFDRESLMNDIQNVVFQSIVRNRTPSSCGSTQSLPTNFGQSRRYSGVAQTYDLEDQQNTHDTFIPAQTNLSQPLLSNILQSSPYAVAAQTYDLEDQQNTQDTFIAAQTTSSQALLSNIRRNRPYSVPARTVFSSYDLEDQQNTQDTIIPEQTTPSQALDRHSMEQSRDHLAPAQTTATSDSARRIIISNTGSIRILDT